MAAIEPRTSGRGHATDWQMVAVILDWPVIEKNRKWIIRAPQVTAKTKVEKSVCLSCFDRLKEMYFRQVSLLKLPGAKISFENDEEFQELFSGRKLRVTKLYVELVVVLKLINF